MEERTGGGKGGKLEEREERRGTGEGEERVREGGECVSVDRK